VNDALYVGLVTSPTDSAEVDSITIDANLKEKTIEERDISGHDFTAWVYHLFRPNEPFAQIIVIPEEAAFTLEPMNEEESAERELQSRRIYASRPALSAETEWTSSTDTVFDGTYRHLHRAAKEKARRD